MSTERIRREVRIKLLNSERFLDMAKALSKQRFYEGCVFYCHRSCELVLKAGTLFFERKMYEHIHVLPDLYNEIRSHIKLSPVNKRKLHELDRDYELARGNSDRTPVSVLFDKDDAEESLKIAEVLLKCVQERIFKKKASLT